MSSAVYLYIYELCSFSNLSVTSPTSQLILQPFRRFTYVTAHSPTLPLLYLCHSSLSNPSFASRTSQALHLIHLASRPCSKGKSTFIFGHEGPRGIWMQGSTYTQTRHQEEVGWLVLTLGRLYPRRKPPVFILLEAQWTPGSVWTRRSEENLHTSDTWDRTQAVQHVAKRLAP